MYVISYYNSFCMTGIISEYSVFLMPSSRYFLWIHDFVQASSTKMLYVFYVDTGMMLTFDMNVALDR